MYVAGGGAGGSMQDSLKILEADIQHANSEQDHSRAILKRVNSGDLWVYMDNKDVIDTGTLTRDNLRRLFLYIDKLPVIVPDHLFDTYDSHLR